MQLGKSLVGVPVASVEDRRALTCPREGNLNVSEPGRRRIVAKQITGIILAAADYENLTLPEAPIECFDDAIDVAATGFCDFLGSQAVSWLQDSPGTEYPGITKRMAHFALAYRCPEERRVRRGPVANLITKVDKGSQRSIPKLERALLQDAREMTTDAVYEVVCELGALVGVASALGEDPIEAVAASTRYVSEMARVNKNTDKVLHHILGDQVPRRDPGRGFHGMRYDACNFRLDARGRLMTIDLSDHFADREYWIATPGCPAQLDGGVTRFARAVATSFSRVGLDRLAGSA